MTEERPYSQIINESVAEFTTHGLPYVFKRKIIIIKIIWLIFTLGSAGACGYFVGKSIIDYFEYETVTKVKTIYEIPTPFPTVSICNQNSFTTNASYEYVKSYLDENDLLDLDDWFPYEFSTTYNSLKLAVGTNLRDSKYSDERRKEMSLQLNYMMLSCAYNNFDCDSSEFYWYYDSFYGSCFSFNIGKNSSGHEIPEKMSTRAGSQNGLHLELFVGESTNIYSLSYLNGLRVLVHNKTERPSYLNGLNVNTGTLTSIAVDREFSSRLEKPYSDCTKDIPSLADKLLFVKTILDYNRTYTQAECFSVCLQKFVVEYCGCYNLDLPYWNTTEVRPCKTINDTECSDLLFLAFYDFDIKELCSEDCPLECESSTYWTSISTIDYPSVVYASFLRQNSDVQAKFDDRDDVSLEELRSNTLAINVYYNKLSYKTVSEAEKTQVIDLVSSVGGTIGLFLGMSFLSFIEFIDMFFYLGLAFYTKRNKIVNPRSIKPL